VSLGVRNISGQYEEVGLTGTEISKLAKSCPAIYRFVIVLNLESSVVLSDRWSGRTDSRDVTLLKMRTEKFCLIFCIGDSFQRNGRGILVRNGLTKSGKLVESSAIGKGRVDYFGISFLLELVESKRPIPRVSGDMVEIPPIREDLFNS
jgi:hypothetical protein